MIQTEKPPVTELQKNPDFKEVEISVELTILDGRIYKGTGRNANRMFLFHYITGTVRNPIAVKILELGTRKYSWRPFDEILKLIDEGTLIWLDAECKSCKQLLCESELNKWRLCADCEKKRMSECGSPECYEYTPMNEMVNGKCKKCQ